MARVSGPFAEAGHRARTLRNYNYDLITELSETLTSLWRMDEYLKDAGAGGCQECGKLWQDVRKHKEIVAEKLREEIAGHVKRGDFM